MRFAARSSSAANLIGLIYLAQVSRPAATRHLFGLVTNYHRPGDLCQ